MILLSFEGTPRINPQIVLIFGSGLIGGSVVQALQRNGQLLRKCALGWSWPIPTKTQKSAVEEAFKSYLGQKPLSHITVIWAAGRSGFGSSEEDMSFEYQAFGGVQTLARKLALQSGQSTNGFVHISSAGGLFEGQIACDENTPPSPIRPYGYGKLKQEISLINDTTLGRRLIVRPSSVFGYIAGGRAGLVTALISAAKQHRVATIFGAFSTQRDFIFASDIGRYIASKIFGFPPQASDVERVLLASGRPATVFEIIKSVEDVIGIPLYLRIDASPENALNNTFKPSALAPGFIPTPLRQGIEQTKYAMEAQSFG